ncbi:MAG: glycosyltransferase [Coriobacteriia bacterium]
MRPAVSVVGPMYNEAENASDTLTAISTVLEARGLTFEILPVDDGSTDGTARELAAFAAREPRVRPVGYAANRGRGHALRTGFDAARGDLVASMDADLSYTTDHLVGMLRILLEDPDTDVVLASPYMPGGSVEGVPFIRLALSRVGNAILRHALSQPVFTSTGIVRAYRREVLESLDLESDGKEIHLEILSQVMALGYRIKEMPAVLRTRRKGSSKFRPRATVLSHLLFSVLARPTALFGAFGMLLLAAGALAGGYLVTVYFQGSLNPERPLMTVMVLLVLGGTGALAFAVLASQLLEMRRALVRMQAEIRRMRSGPRDDG